MYATDITIRIIIQWVLIICLRIVISPKQITNCIKETAKKGLQSWCGMLYNNEVVKSDIQFIVGVDDVEGPPVPMPNTEVKLDSAENTRMVTSREDRKMPTFKAAAQ